MASHPLNETLFGLFYDVFKRTGIPLRMDQLDALRVVTDKITAALQNEIKDGMKKVATIAITEMKALEERLNGSKNTEEIRNN
jgi:hypothetical protein